jgi:murein L,D-transpeptidase YafK
VIVVLCFAQACGEEARTNPCVQPDPHLLVETSRHELWLCQDGKPTRSYDVRLGKGGRGKTQEGDGKVPLGEYPLAAARPSSRFGLFIEIGYPTQDQRAKGYTGSAIGIHGPRRELAWLGDVNNWFDTTDGCVGLASDSEAIEISEWMTQSGAARIVLR